METTIKVTKVMQPRVYQKKDGTQGCTYQFVGETQGQYPKTIHFQVFGEDRFNAMQLAEGGMYQVDFEIESRAWKDTFITSCTAWRVTRTDNAMPQQAPQPQPQGYYPPQQWQQPQPQQQYTQSPAPQPQGGYNDYQSNDPLPF